MWFFLKILCHCQYEGSRAERGKEGVLHCPGLALRLQGQGGTKGQCLFISSHWRPGLQVLKIRRGFNYALGNLVLPFGKTFILFINFFGKT